MAEGIEKEKRLGFSRKELPGRKFDDLKRLLERTGIGHYVASKYIPDESTTIVITGDVGAERINTLLELIGVSIRI